MWSLDAFVLQHGAHSRIRVVRNVAVELSDALYNASHHDGLAVDGQRSFAHKELHSLDNIGCSMCCSCRCSCHAKKRCGDEGRENESRF